LRELPYRKLHDVRQALRKLLFTKEWRGDDHPSIIVNKPTEEIETNLRSWHFERAYLTYNYEGQILDLRRPEGVKDGYQQEVHIRARENPDGDGLELIGHIEDSRYEHKKQHMEGLHFDPLDEDELRDVISGGGINTEGGVVDTWS
jgi:hypothetical protein